MEAASPAPATLQLASAVLELAISRQVASHAQAFVRRCALVTCSQVCDGWCLAWPGVCSSWCILPTRRVEGTQQL